MGRLAGVGGIELVLPRGEPVEHGRRGVARAAPMQPRLVKTTAVVFPDPADDRREERLPPTLAVPSAEIVMKVFRSRCLPHEHRKSEVSAALVQEPVDEAGLLLPLQLALPQVVEVALLEDAARRQRAARERVTNAQAEEVVLKPCRLTDEAGSVGGGGVLQMKVHVRVAGARLGRHVEMVKLPRRGERVIEVRIDLLEVSHDGAAERGHTVEDEEIRVPAGGELVIEVDVDELGT